MRYLFSPSSSASFSISTPDKRGCDAMRCDAINPISVLSEVLAGQLRALGEEPGRELPVLLLQQLQLQLLRGAGTRESPAQRDRLANPRQPVTEPD